MKKLIFAMMLGIFCLSFGGWSGVKKNTAETDTKKEPVVLEDTIVNEWDWGMEIREIYSNGTEIDTISYYGDNMGQLPHKVEKFIENGQCVKEISFDENIDVSEETDYCYDENGELKSKYTKWPDGNAIQEEMLGDQKKSTFWNSDGSRLESYDGTDGERIRSVYYYPITTATTGRRETIFKDSLVDKAFMYDRADNLLSREEYEYGNDGELVKCVYYDGTGKVTAIEDIQSGNIYYSEFGYWIARNYIIGLGAVFIVMIITFGVLLIFGRRKKSE